MVQKLRQRMGREEGFTLVELLVVMLILGLLAAIAIPSFFNQRDKAKDADAKAEVRTAQTAMETYATDNGGEYTGARLRRLKDIEPTLNDADLEEPRLRHASRHATRSTIDLGDTTEHVHHPQRDDQTWVDGAGLVVRPAVKADVRHLRRQLRAGLGPPPVLDDRAMSASAKVRPGADRHHMTPRGKDAVRRLADERGMTMIELLTVVVILGTLMAIAVPAFFHHRDRASDANAKASARAAQTAAMEIGQEYRGSYADVSVTNLIESSRPFDDASLTVPMARPDTFTVRVQSETGNTFDVRQNTDGTVDLTCASADDAGCPADGTWD